MNTPIKIIACGIFQEEIEHLLAQEQIAIDPTWLEVGLHDNIEKLESTLEGHLVGADRPGLLYGTACLPEMKKFAREHQTVTLPVRNCLAALVGDEQLKELEQNRTLVASPGWVRKMWLGRVGTDSGWTADDYRMHFGRYDLILILDPGLNPLTDEEIITCYDLVQVPLEIRPCDLDHFRLVFKELLAQTAAAK